MGRLCRTALYDFLNRSVVNTFSHPFESNRATDRIAYRGFYPISLGLSPKTKYFLYPQPGKVRQVPCLSAGINQIPYLMLQPLSLNNLRMIFEAGILIG